MSSKFYASFLGGAVAACCLVSSSVCAEPTGTPQPVLEKAPLTIKTSDGKVHKFSVELAKTAAQQEKGEMFRKQIPADGGMLFLWPRPRQADMWMRHTLVPLDIVFIDNDHHVHAIVENAVPQSEAVIGSHGVVAATLELPAGTTQTMGVEVGDLVAGSALDAGH